MSNVVTDPLEQLFRQAGEEWLIDWYTTRSQALQHLRRLLEQADQRAAQRFGSHAPRLTAEALLQEQEANPHKVRALLQIMASVGSPDMLVMAWRIMQGMNIDAMQMEYEQEKTFRLRIRLVSMDNAIQKEEYETTDIDDAVVLRHFGIMKMNDRPVFDGFYPLRVLG